MSRRWLWVIVVALSVAPSAGRADEFDQYTNKLLGKVAESKGVRKVEKLTPELLIEHSGVLKDAGGAFVVVRTNEGRWSRLLVQPARQKVKTSSVPILLIDRFVTFREGEDRAVQAEGKGVRLFKGFVLSLDLGQIVPASLGGDIRFVEKEGETYAEPVGKAELYLVTQPIPVAAPQKGDRPDFTRTFQPSFFAGTYKLHEDGRRSGELHLKVGEDGAVTGHYYSDKDGRKYEVKGKIGDPHHKINFSIIYPRTVQHFTGWMFTGDGSAITGVARMEQRESGFYALRKE